MDELEQRFGGLRVKARPPASSRRVRRALVVPVPAAVCDTLTGDMETLFSKCPKVLQVSGHGIVCTKLLRDPNILRDRTSDEFQDLFDPETREDVLRRNPDSGIGINPDFLENLDFFVNRLNQDGCGLLSCVERPCPEYNYPNLDVLGCVCCVSLKSDAVEDFRRRSFVECGVLIHEDAFPADLESPLSVVGQHDDGHGCNRTEFWAAQIPDDWRFYNVDGDAELAAWAAEAFGQAKGRKVAGAVLRKTFVGLGPPGLHGRAPPDSTLSFRQFSL